MRDELPFPGILGRICPRYCEPVCRRAEVDEPIAICALHRAAGDHAPAALAAAPATGKRVAVIGAGPAGLSCAWFLAQAGHEVTIYDKADKPGGMLRYSIPSFRLPEDVLDAELQPLWDAGVRFVDNVALGVDVNPYGLMQAGFNAIFVGVGAWQTMPSRIPGHEAMLDSLELLRDAHDGKKVRLGGTVAVLGDGTVAMDSARAALRLGAKRVVVLARHAEADVDAGQRELAAAREEGVEFEFLVDARRVKLGKSGKAAGLECVRLQPGTDGKLTEVKGSRFELKADAVVSALSYVPDLGESSGELSALRLEHPGGQLLHRPHQGRRRVRRRRRRHRRQERHPRGGRRQAGRPGHRRLARRRGPGGAGGQAGRLRRPALPRPARRRAQAGRARRASRRAQPRVAEDGHRRRPRQADGDARHSRSPQRTASFDEVEKGLGKKAAQAEAARCLQCTCEANGQCDLQSAGRAVRHHRERAGGARAPACARSRRATSTRSSAGTWTAASPAAAACGSAGTWPARPATTSAAAAS